MPGTTETTALVIKRFLEGGKVCARTECAPQHITVLSDESGGVLAAYEAALAGKAPDRIVLELNGGVCDHTQLFSVGYADKLPEDQKPKEYLIQHGYAAHEVDQVIAHYELDKAAFLPCSHITQVPSRQILLLAALRSPAPVIALNDPFLPFSGRWREAFAKLFLELCARKIIIVTNLSFVPTIWSQSSALISTDVSWNEEGALREYRGELERQKKQMERELKKQGELENSAADKYRKKPIFVIPENVKFAYKETVDFLIEPLGAIATFLRSYSGAVVAGSFALLVLFMGFVMYPNMDTYRAKLSALADKYQYASLASLLAPTQTPAKVTEQPKKVKDIPKPDISVTEPETDDTLVEDLEDTDLEEVPEEIVMIELPPCTGEQSCGVAFEDKQAITAGMPAWVFDTLAWNSDLAPQNEDLSLTTCADQTVQPETPILFSAPTDAVSADPAPANSEAQPATNE